MTSKIEFLFKNDIKEGCVESERCHLSCFELCAFLGDDSNGATESFWELNGVDLWPFQENKI